MPGCEAVNYHALGIRTIIPSAAQVGDQDAKPSKAASSRTAVSSVPEAIVQATPRA
jgi:hypothetical protein